MIRVLAFDCSCARLSVALAETGDGATLRLLAEHDESLVQGHAARLLPAIEATLLRVAIDPADIDLFAVTVGPGSFTGVRIGLATARGLALATGRPLAGYPTLDVLLAAAIGTAGRTLVAAIDTKRGDAYLKVGSGAPFVGRVEALRAQLTGDPVRLVGDASESLAGELSKLGVDAEADDRVAAPSAAVLARLALHDGPEHWRAANRGSGLPRPLYLRPADVTLPDGTRSGAGS
jgi:tRNA threonylcarbamoyladenosine biosynthesis protein TsaB